LNEYGRESKSTVYFDDLGLEEVNVKMFGNSANVMSEILIDRYDSFKTKGVLTYASSNLTPSQFEDVYGARMRDRMKEMFNLITVKGESFRK
jgi:DNA replication protein DnaC